jgi:hypothetical protein
MALRRRPVAQVWTAEFWPSRDLPAGNLNVPTEPCEEQAALATAVVDAIKKVYVARRDLEAARAEKAETERLVIALHNVRAPEQHAVSALDNHKKEHRCRNNSA